jgi:predicted Fe-Mo cluster-binding NifX family protein
MKIAVATSSGAYIDLHFGHAEQLTILDVDEAGKILSTEQRPGLGSCVCKDSDEDSGGHGGNEGGHDEEQMKIVFNSLADCKYLLTKRIGMRMVRELARREVTSFELLGEIQPAIDKIVQYEQRQQQNQAIRKE